MNQLVLFVVKDSDWAALVVQWLRVHLPMQGDRDSSPGLGGSHIPQSN